MPTTQTFPVTGSLEVEVTFPGPVAPPPSSVTGLPAHQPNGRLTLDSGNPIMRGGMDHVSTTLHYAPYNGNRVSIFDGTDDVSHEFTTNDTDAIGLSMDGGVKWVVGSSYDVFDVVVGGVVKLATGPAWPSSALAARGLVKRKGLWVNVGPMALDLSETEQITVPMHQASAVGSIHVSDTEGTLKALFTPGHNRTCDVFNFYNQEMISLPVGQPPVGGVQVSWTPTNNYTGVGYLAFNNNNNNCGYSFVGLPGVEVEALYLQRGFIDAYNKGICAANIAVSKNTVSNTRGTLGSFNSDIDNIAVGVSLPAHFLDTDTLGRNRLFMVGSNSNDVGVIGTTLWGLGSATGKEMGAHVMWIRYKG